MHKYCLGKKMAYKTIETSLPGRVEIMIDRPDTAILYLSDNLKEVKGMSSGNFLELRKRGIRTVQVADIPNYFTRTSFIDDEEVARRNEEAKSHIMGLLQTNANLYGIDVSHKPKKEQEESEAQQAAETVEPPKPKTEDLEELARTA